MFQPPQPSWFLKPAAREDSKPRNFYHGGTEVRRHGEHRENLNFQISKLKFVRIIKISFKVILSSRHFGSYPGFSMLVFHHIPITNQIIIVTAPPIILEFVISPEVVVRMSSECIPAAAKKDLVSSANLPNKNVPPTQTNKNTVKSNVVANRKCHAHQRNPIIRKRLIFPDGRNASCKKPLQKISSDVA